MAIYVSQAPFEVAWYPSGSTLWVSQHYLEVAYDALPSIQISQELFEVAWVPSGSNIWVGQSYLEVAWTGLTSKRRLTHVSGLAVIQRNPERRIRTAGVEVAIKGSYETRAWIRPWAEVTAIPAGLTIRTVHATVALLQVGGVPVEGYAELAPAAALSGTGNLDFDLSKDITVKAILTAVGGSTFQYGVATILVSAYLTAQGSGPVVGAATLTPVASVSGNGVSTVDLVAEIMVSAQVSGYGRVSYPLSPSAFSYLVIG